MKQGRHGPPVDRAGESLEVLRKADPPERRLAQRHPEAFIDRHVAPAKGFGPRPPDYGSEQSRVYPQCGQTSLHLISRIAVPHTQQV
jgi:hypothetical protein